MRRLALFGFSSLVWAGMALAQSPGIGLAGSGQFGAFDAQISSDEMRGWMKQMAAEPNQVGGPHDKANADWLLAQFKAYGFDAHIETIRAASIIRDMTRSSIIPASSIPASSMPRRWPR